MKKIALIFAIFNLTFIGLVTAQNTLPTATNPVLDSAEKIMKEIQAAIFTYNPEDKIVFVDFAGFQENIATVKVLKNQKDLYFDDVSDIHPSSIYEIPMSGYNGKFYTIVITTETGKSFRQSVWLEGGQLVWK